MPGSAGSSWYFMRYIDPKNDKELCDKKLLEHWLPVDLYIGGPEHAVGHLMYSRIWTKYLHSKGICPVDEPFKKLVHQGMILGSNGIKMGKRFPQYVVNPSDIVEKYGADTLRLYEMFMGPLEASKPWSDAGVEGARRFIDRVWRFVASTESNSKFTKEYNSNIEVLYNQTVKKVTNDFERLSFNTAISQMMVFLNEATKLDKIYIGFVEGYVKLLSPIIPHICEEMWQVLGHDGTIAFESWPTYDEAKTKNATVTYAVSVNGKLRDKLVLDPELSKEEVEKLAFQSPKIKSYTDGHEIVKVIVVPKKIVNIVIK